MAPKDYTGSCHCGLIRWTARIDLQNNPTGKCNCTSCLKTRAWELLVSPSDFALHPSCDPANLTDYTFGSKRVHHLFCKSCGVRSFGRGDLPGWLGEFVAVSVVCLEGVSDAEMAGLEVVFRNGREDRYGEEPAVTGHL